MSGRNGALVNGALVTVGGLAMVDNVVVHWLLGLHRALPDPGASLPVEVALVVLGAVLAAVGLRREARARRSS